MGMNAWNNYDVDTILDWCHYGHYCTLYCTSTTLCLKKL